MLKPSESTVYRYTAGLLLVAPISGFTYAQSNQAGFDTPAASRIDEIVVTAQKREQSLQEVPASVTALSGDAIRVNRITNVADLNAIAPNLTVRPSAGALSIPSFTLRGVQNIAAIPGADKQIGIYIDGVYVFSPAGSVFDLPEIERIEVLKGPQGTLFGQNATAGAVSIVTPEPKGEFGLVQDFTFGNYDQFWSKTRLDLPRMGPVSAYVSYWHRERRGDIRNLGAGTVWDFQNATKGGLSRVTAPKYLGDEDINSVQGTVRLDPSEDFSLSYKFYWVERKGTPEGSGNLGIDFSVLGPQQGALFDAILASQPNPELLTAFSATRPTAVNNWLSGRSNLENEGHIVSAQWDVSDRLSLKNTFGYLSTETLAINQLDGFGGLVNTLPIPGLPPVGTPLTLLANMAASESSQWSNEIQLNYQNDFLTVTAGYLHFDGKIEQGAVPGLLQNYNFSFMPDFVIPGSSLGMPTNRTKSDAIYAQMEFDLTSKWALILGARYIWDEKSGTAPFPELPQSFDYRKSKPTYTVGVNYTPTEDMLLYAKYSTAYMAGGSYAGLPWEPEEAESWEAGVKTEFFDRRIVTNLAVFRVEYDEIQNSTSGAILAQTTGRPELAQLAGVLVNGGEARAQGFELEVTAAPWEGLTLGAGVGYTDFKWLAVNPLVGTIDDFDAILRPKWTTNLSAQYTTRPIFNETYLYWRLDSNYRSSYDTTTRSFIPELERMAQADATWIVNGRVALADIDLGKITAELAVWGRNLTNDKTLSNNTVTPFLYPVTYERARTYGIDLRFEF